MNSDVRDERRIELHHGSHFNIRSLRRGEVDAVRELCARLSPRSRYLRFLSPIHVVPDSLVRMLADVDDPRRLALVAESNSGGDVVALGNVGGIDDNHAEFALVVADAWQRRGIGVALASRLLGAAARRGYHRFVAHGFSDNPALRPLLNRLATVVSTKTRSGVSEITFVRREPAVAPAGPIDGPPVTPAQDLLDKAYERILAAKGGTSSH